MAADTVDDSRFTSFFSTQSFFVDKFKKNIAGKDVPWPCPTAIKNKALL